MRSFEKTTKALALVAFAALAATPGCVAEAADDDATAQATSFEDVGETAEAWAEEPTPPPTQLPPEIPPPVQQPPFATPPVQQPPLQQPPVQQPPVQQAPVQQPPIFATPGIGAPGLPVGGCAGGCAAPCGWAAGFHSFPGGFHTVVWPITGQFIAIPGLRNCWLAGCGC